MAVHSPQRARRSGAHTEKSEIVENTANTATDLATLPSLSHADLKSRWTETFGTAPPKGLSRRLLICALAYEIQARDEGRLKPAARKQLVEIATPNAPGPASEVPPLPPGTRLMREWRGTVHVVDVIDDGLVWNGRVYASLSAIARTITGTRWSGHRFFGLRKRSDALDASKTAQARASSDEALQIAAPQTDEPLCSNEQGAENSASLDNIMEVATSGPPSIDPEPETVS